MEGSWVSRWVRIFWITTGSSMQAMIRNAPPQAGQVSMSMPTTRFSRCVRPSHRCSTFHRRLRLPLIGSLGFGALPPFRRCHRGAVSTVGGQYALQARQIDPGLRHPGGESGDEVERLDQIAGSDFDQPKADPKGGGQDARSHMVGVVPSRYGVLSG
jgi:hypothetical protein